MLTELRIIYWCNCLAEIVFRRQMERSLVILSWKYYSKHYTILWRKNYLTLKFFFKKGNSHGMSVSILYERAFANYMF